MMLGQIGEINNPRKINWRIKVMFYQNHQLLPLGRIFDVWMPHLVLLQPIATRSQLISFHHLLAPASLQELQCQVKTSSS